MWYLNNISDSAVGGYMQTSFQFYWDMPSHNANWLWDMSDTVVERNFIRDNAYSSTRYMVGHNYNYTGCNGQYYTTDTFNTCSATWRGVGSVLNFEQNGGSLFQGASESDQYKTVGAYDVDGAGGSYTIANGGIGSDHPYLDDVTIPSYIGATNPNDNGWVEDVMSFAEMDANNVPTNLKNSLAVDLDDGEPAQEDTTPPSTPSGLSVE